MTTKNVKLYNLVFPIWLLWLIPVTWIVVLPANFLIDLLVLVLTMKCIKVHDIKRNAKAVILSVWICGFIADFIGCAAMFMPRVINFDHGTPLANWWYNNITNAVMYNPFDSIYAVLWVTICVIIAAFFIYLFNYKVCLHQSSLDNDQKKRLSLSLAVCTAPYFFIFLWQVLFNFMNKQLEQDYEHLRCFHELPIGTI